MSDASLILETTDTADSPVFDQFYGGYTRAFVLPEEMEDEDGFRACLDLNHGAAKQTLEPRYGPFREICLVVRDAGDDSFVGGANLIAAPGGMLDGRPVVTANLNYVYVDASQRGKRRFRPMLEAIKTHVAAMFGDGDALALVFIEQNDPIAMSAEAYERDTHFTGMDQFDRLRVWVKAGALMVDTDYIQPPLSPDHPPVDTLVLSVLGAGDRRDLPARLVHDHLAKFFGISVLKGEALDDNAAASGQLAKLALMEEEGKPVALVELVAALTTTETPEAIRARIGVGRFRAAVADGRLVQPA